MSDDFKKQIYNTLNLKETDELVEIWQTHDNAEWTEVAFDVVKEILLIRLGELPAPAQPLPIAIPYSPKVKLWTPRTIGFIMFFLGFPGGIVLASINWIRMGMKKKALIHIIGIIVGVFVLLWAALSIVNNVRPFIYLTVNIGLLFYIQGQMSDDIDKFKATKHNVQNANWMIGCLIGLSSLGFYLIPAMFLSPANAYDYYNRGVDYQLKGDYDRAIAEYTQAIRLKPDYEKPYNNRGLAYREKGNYDNAIADFTHAIVIKPDFADAYFNRGNTYTVIGDYDHAIVDFTKVIQFNSNDAVAYYLRGLAYESQSHNHDAIIDFERVLVLTTDQGLRQKAESELTILKGK